MSETKNILETMKKKKWYVIIGLLLVVIVIRGIYQDATGTREVEQSQKNSTQQVVSQVANVENKPVVVPEKKAEESLKYQIIKEGSFGDDGYAMENICRKTY